MLAFTDGGPDHNISFLNVMISWLAYFIISGCDSLVVARTTPTQSWTNPAERLMSVLNLALSNSALAREAMSEEFENNMKNCNSMASVRNMAKSLEASAARAPTPIRAHASAPDVAAKTSAVDAPSTSTSPCTSSAAASSVADVADASTEPSLPAFVDVISGISGKT